MIVCVIKADIQCVFNTARVGLSQDLCQSFWLQHCDDF